jgi:hypothetical protein
MASYQTPESKKQEFRKYLENSGVIDALTKGEYDAFVSACEEMCRLRKCCKRGNIPVGHVLNSTLYAR